MLVAKRRSGERNVARSRFAPLPIPADVEEEKKLEERLLNVMKENNFLDYLDNDVNTPGSPGQRIRLVSALSLCRKMENIDIVGQQDLDMLLDLLKDTDVLAIFPKEERRYAQILRAKARRRKGQATAARMRFSQLRARSCKESGNPQPEVPLTWPSYLGEGWKGVCHKLATACSAERKQVEKTAAPQHRPRSLTYPASEPPPGSRIIQHPRL